MIITKNLTPTLFFAALFMLTMTNSHQLHAMKKEKINPSLDADFQSYKLLSSLNNDHLCYLLPELIQIITANVSKVIDKDCYEEYEAYQETYPEDKKSIIHKGLYSMILLQFITNKLDNKSLNHISIATIIKRYLRHSGKSLGEIKDIWSHRTVFHNVGSKRIIYPENDVLVRLMRIKILFLVVSKKEAWDIICMVTDSGLNSLITNSCYPDNITPLLSKAPNPQEAWNLIMTPCYLGDNALKAIEHSGSSDNKHYLLQNRPDMIDENYIETLKILESYRQ